MTTIALRHTATALTLALALVVAPGARADSFNVETDGVSLDTKGFADLCKKQFDAMVQAVLLGDARGPHAQRVMKTQGTERRTVMLARAVRSPTFKRQAGIPLAATSNHEAGDKLAGWGYGALNRKDFIATVVPAVIKSDNPKVLKFWENRLEYWNNHIRKILGVPPGTDLRETFKRIREQCPDESSPRLLGPRTRLLAELVRSTAFQKRHASEIRAVVRENSCD